MLKILLIKSVLLIENNNRLNYMTHNLRDKRQRETEYKKNKNKNNNRKAKIKSRLKNDSAAISLLRFFVFFGWSDNNQRRAKERLRREVWPEKTNLTFVIGAAFSSSSRPLSRLPISLYGHHEREGQRYQGA